MPGYIPISGLNNFTVVSTDDYVALVDSASFTTYRVPIQSFLDLVAISGSVVSSSYASASITSITSSMALYSISSSWSNSSSVAYNSYRADTSSLSFLLIGSHTGSTLGTSSWSINSTFSSHSYVSNTCSISISSSYATLAATTISSSWSSESITASYSRNSGNSMSSSYSTTASFARNAATASYVLPIASIGVKAYGAISFWADNGCVGAGSWTSPTIRASHNINSIVYDSAYLYNPATAASFRPYRGQQYKVTFSTPLPSTSYVVIVTSGGEERSEGIMWTVYPFTKTTSSFWITRCEGGSADNNGPYVESNWLEFAVIQ